MSKSLDAAVLAVKLAQAYVAHNYTAEASVRGLATYSAEKCAPSDALKLLRLSASLRGIGCRMIRQAVCGYCSGPSTTCPNCHGTGYNNPSPQQIKQERRRRALSAAVTATLAPYGLRWAALADGAVSILFPDSAEGWKI